MIEEMYYSNNLALEVTEATEAAAVDADDIEAFEIAHHLFIEEEANVDAVTTEVLYEAAVLRFEANATHLHDECVLGMSLPLLVAGDDKYTHGIRGLLFLAACFDESGQRLTPHLPTIERHTRRWIEITDRDGLEEEKICFKSLVSYIQRFDNRLSMFWVEMEKDMYGDLLFRIRLQGAGVVPLPWRLNE
jgi:hypothetical protein